MKKNISTEFMSLLEGRRLLSGTAADVAVSTPVGGIVYSDSVVKNNKVDAGEALAGCVVTFNNNVDHTVSTPVTGTEGNFSTFLVPGTYTLTIDGPTVSTPYTDTNFVVGTTPINEDFKVTTDGETPPPAGKPDLSVTVSNLPNALAPAASSVPVTVTVANKGAAYKGPLTATVYFSTNKTIDGHDIVLKTLKLPSVSIAAGSSTPILSINAAAVADLLPPGKWYLLVGLSNLTGGDSNSADNTDSSDAATTVSKGAPNLAPVMQNKPTVAGRVLNFKMSVKNTGVAAAVGKVTVRLSARPTKGGADVTLPAVPPFAVNVGANSTMTPGKSIAANIAGLHAGTYQLVLTITTSLTTAESKTSDNTLVGGTFVVK